MIPYVDYGLCEGCGACAELFPAVFEMLDDKAWVRGHESFLASDREPVVNCCPFHAITVE